MGKKTADKRRSDYKGLKKVLVRLEDRHVKALTVAARRRMEKRGAIRGDKSELVREALDMHPELKRGQ
jgi:hypothetical protein